MEKDKKIKNINLAFPCREDWDTMSISDQERVCEKCSNRVHDFTDKTASQLEEIMDKSETVVCGRFSKSQISEVFVKYAASTLLVASGFLNPVLGQQVIQADSLHQACEHVHEEEEIFFGMVLEEQPIPKSGLEGFYKKIAAEIKFPEGLTQKGRVFIGFTVDTTGKIRDVEVVKGLNEFADREALRVITAIDETFIPARQRGKVVKTRMVFPITFDPEPKKKRKK